jgi:predicted phosphodiesterase
MINSNDRSSLRAKVLVLKEAGYTVSEVAQKLTLPRSTVWDWFNDRKRNNTEYPIAYVNDNLTVQRAVRSSIDIEAFLEQLAPIELPDIFISNPKKELSNYVIVLNDLHFPLHCQKSIDIALTVIDELKPKSIIINGDSLDMLAISRFPKDIRTQYNLLEERIEYHKFLYSLIEISNGSEIIEVHGNHSGDSTFGRWWRYLGERIPELACLPDIKEKLSYQNVFLGELQNNVSMADYVELTPDLIVLHGDVVRKHGGASARGTLDKYFQSSIMGHTHRVGSTAQRIPAMGNRKDKQIYAWEMGCMCDLNPLYGSAPNWQNAFGIISLGDDNSYGIETVMINNGKANVTTLGKTITV